MGGGVDWYALARAAVALVVLFVSTGLGSGALESGSVGQGSPIDALAAWTDGNGDVSEVTADNGSPGPQPTSAPDDNHQGVRRTRLGVSRLQGGDADNWESDSDE